MPRTLRALALEAEDRLAEEVDARAELQRRAEVAEARCAQLEHAAAEAEAATEAERAAGRLTHLVTVLRAQLIRAGVTDIPSAFAAFDTDGDGTLTAEELAAGLRKLRIGLSEQQLQELMAAVDVDGDEELTIAEFSAQFERLAALEEAGYRRELAHREAVELASAVLHQMHLQLQTHGMTAEQAFMMADGENPCPTLPDPAPST